MVETITFRPIYIEDLALGTGTATVQLADGSTVALTKINLTSLASGVASASSYLDLAEQSTAPATPSASTTRLYQKTDGYWYTKNSAGTETEFPATVGTVTRGTWNGTAIGVAYGGTALTSATTGGMLYASATNTYSALAIGTSGYVLKSNGTTPTWAQTPYTTMFCGGATPSAGTIYAMATGNTVSTETVIGVPVAKTGSLSNLFIRSYTTGASDTVVTVRKNGADTTLTATISAGGTSASDTTHSVSVTAGDYIAMKLVSVGGSPFTTWGFLFTE